MKKQKKQKATKRTVTSETVSSPEKKRKLISESVSKYTLKFEYVKGIKNTLADTMSRLVTLDPDIKLTKEPEGYQFGKQVESEDNMGHEEVKLISLAPVALVTKTGNPTDPIPDKDV